MSLEVCSLRFSYESQDFQLVEKNLLDNITFNAHAIMQIKGKNGSGKTTLLRILAGIIEPISGNIKYKDYSIFDNYYDYKNSICYVGHKLGLNSQLTVFENCHFFLKNTKTKFEIIELLKIFSLDGLQNKLVSYLSAGQKKRLSLLKVLLADSKLWILDEPFTALDKDFVELFVSHMRKHVMSGGIIIYSSHQAVAIDDIEHSEYYL